MGQLHLISGMHRSGSTLLCNILNMNPAFRATATSPLIEAVKSIKACLSTHETFLSSHRTLEQRKVKRAMKAFIGNYHEYDTEITFDKSRDWVNFLPVLDSILGHEDTKIIWTYRDPIQIYESFEKNHKRTLLFDHNLGNVGRTRRDRFQACLNKCALVCADLEEALDNGYENRILLVDYDDLTVVPQTTLNRIHAFLGMPNYFYESYNFSDLKQSTFENDGVFNYKFSHQIKEGGIANVINKSTLPVYMQNEIKTKFSWIKNVMHINNNKS